MQVIASTYVSLIVAGRRTFSQVPGTVKEMVRADLVALGYDFESETV
ncbi:CD1375 family protein [Paenibacillus crassostreae]|nr:CD1375 family protein [Paenibacillus crassostreae]